MKKLFEQFNTFRKSDSINGKRVALIGVLAASLLYVNYKVTKHFYFQAYYKGCVELAESKLFDKDQTDYLYFKCNFNTKLQMYRMGEIDEILLFTDVFPDAQPTQ